MPRRSKEPPPPLPSQCTRRSYRTGQRCRLRPLVGKRLCKFHGGTLNGPTTEAGRQRRREAGMANLARWQARMWERRLAGDVDAFANLSRDPNRMRPKAMAVAKPPVERAEIDWETLSMDEQRRLGLVACEVLAAWLRRQAVPVAASSV